MTCYFVYCAEIELGYEYDEQLGYIQPCEWTNLPIKGLECNTWQSAFANDLALSMKLGLFLNQNWLTYLDNELNIDDENRYYNFFYRRCNEVLTCQDYHVFDLKDKQYVIAVYRGLFLNLIVKKNGLPSSELEARELIKDAIEYKMKLSPQQEQLECHVVINGKEKRKMTLKEFVQFCKTHQYDEEYECEYGVLVNNVSLVSKLGIDNETEFKEFLKYLYLCYRKIESQLEQSQYIVVRGYPCGSLTEIINHLRKCIREFKAVDKGDSLRMYQVMKKLFRAYQNYLEFCFRNRRNIVEGANLPVKANEIKMWFKELNRRDVNHNGDVEISLGVEVDNDLDVDKLCMENEGNFKAFLRSLYCFYRKMEEKLESVGYADIYECKLVQSLTIRKVGGNLQKCIEEYRNMNRDSLLKMYPVIKKLYFSYKQYLEFCLNNGYKIDEGEELPGTVDEVNKLIQRLDTWSITKVENQWFEARADSSDFHLIKGPDANSSFGFVSSIASSTLNDKQNQSDVYESICPNMDCPDVSKKWLCSDCGDLMRITSLQCKCRERDVRKLHFTCTSDTHLKSTRKELLKTIINQLSKYGNQYDNEKNINEIIQKLRDKDVADEEIH